MIQIMEFFRSPEHRDSKTVNCEKVQRIKNELSEMIQTHIY